MLSEMLNVAEVTCQHNNVKRVHRSGSAEWLCGLAGYRPYQCSTCRERLLRRTHKSKLLTISTLILLVLIVLYGLHQFLWYLSS